MLFMMFFYWRIYLVASRTTKALKRGYKSTKKSGTGAEEERFTLRMHRGVTACEDSSSTIPSPRMRHPYDASRKKKPTIIETQFDESDSQTQAQDETQLVSGSTRTRGSHLNPGGDRFENRNRLSVSPSASVHSNLGVLSPCSSRAGSARSSAASTRATRRTNTGKFQARRFHAETKAAKTVGIIVGGFVVCWLPFFTAYPIRAFCDDESCIPKTLMSVFTWLGYCNSAINPVIYGLFSRDFRRAFKTIVCKCTFHEEVGVSSLIRQIHLPTFLDPNLQNTFQDDLVEDDTTVKSERDELRPDLR
jgi:octopamine receptor